MASTRTQHNVTIEPTIIYQIKLNKADLNKIGEGRRKDGTVTQRIFKIWDSNDIINRTLSIKTAANAAQVLMPIKVEDTQDAFVVHGFLLSAQLLSSPDNFSFDEKKELEHFVKYNEHKKLTDNLYEFSQCNVGLNINRSGLFAKPLSSAASLHVNSSLQEGNSVRATL